MHCSSKMFTKLPAVDWLYPIWIVIRSIVHLFFCHAWSLSAICYTRSMFVLTHCCCHCWYVNITLVPMHKFLAMHMTSTHYYDSLFVFIMHVLIILWRTCRWARYAMKKIRRISQHEEQTSWLRWLKKLCIVCIVSCATKLIFRFCSAMGDNHDDIICSFRM